MGDWDIWNVGAWRQKREFTAIQGSASQKQVDSGAIRDMRSSTRLKIDTLDIHEPSGDVRIVPCSLI
ncbi:hypothetical protein [Burkholderia sp. F1]|uniref:hypothetical protein n=1 Tax=Burkholderia sp. F1 TaxID=3366817 RepID=UPI003D750996